MHCNIRYFENRTIRSMRLGGGAKGWTIKLSISVDRYRDIDFQPGDQLHL